MDIGMKIAQYKPFQDKRNMNDIFAVKMPWAVRMEQENDPKSILVRSHSHISSARGKATLRAHRFT